jgi:3-oxoacyl-[acyl-carrier protein] reductase
LVNPSEVTTAFANPERKESNEADNKIGSADIATAILSIVEMRDKTFVPEITVWATNPF